MREIRSRSTHTHGDVTFNFFQKSAKKPLFPHALSAIPQKTKNNIAHNELQRRLSRCSTAEDKEHNTIIFRDLLRSNGYDDKQSSSILTRHRRPRTNRNTTKKPAYFKFPFISDSIDRKIRQIFLTHELPVRIYRQSTTLRQTLQKKPTSKICDLNNCKLNSEHCLSFNCVYFLKCTRCNKLYIGSTIRPLHIRFKEHLNNVNSSIHKHLSYCKSTFLPNILASDPNCINLRFKEAIMISKLSPSINSKIERDELMYLIY